MERHHSEDVMADRDPSRPDAYEQTGGGLRELLQRFNAARTREEFQSIAAEAARRGARPGLEPTIETAYGVLVSLVRKRVAALTAGEGADVEGDA
jgi:hypothetical protein